MTNRPRATDQACLHLLREAGCDWEYAFPRISLVDLSGLREHAQPDDPARYDPAKAMEQQLEAGQKKAEMDRLQEKLDEAYREEYEAAKYKLPPPPTRNCTVFGTITAIGRIAHTPQYYPMVPPGFNGKPY